jgi:hypothetical protein
MLRQLSNSDRHVFLAIFLCLFNASSYAEKSGANTNTSESDQEKTSPFSLLNPERGNVKEFYSSNRDNRLLVRIHMLGDTSSGIYYVPDNSTLLDVFGYAGGQQGVFADTKMLIYRVTNNKNKRPEETETKVTGRDLLTEAALRNYRVQNGDVIFVDSPPKSDTLLRTLTIVSSILGIISGSAAIYFIATR